MDFKTILDARIFLVNKETELYYDDKIDDNQYDDIIDEILTIKIKSGHFNILKEDVE